MKICPKCNTQLDDNAVFCTNCGAQFVAPQQPQPQQQQQPPQQPQQPNYAPGAVPPQQNYAPAYDMYDHTAEFDAQDISDNKVFAMLGYLFGTVGVIIALLASRASAFTMFHVRQALKFTVVNVLMAICALVLCWTIIVPLAYAVMTVVLLVIKIICFFQVCFGKAQEPAIIRSLKFLR